MGPRRVSIGRREGDPAGRGRHDDAGSGSRDPERERRKGAARVGRVAAVVTLVMVLGYGALALALHLLLDPDDLAAWVAPRLGGALNRQVELDAAAVVLIPRPGARLSGIAIENLPGFEGPRVAELAELRVDFSLLPLLMGRIDVRRIRAAGAELHLAVDEYGESNFGNLVPEGAGPMIDEARRPVSLGVRSIQTVDGRVTYTDLASGRSLRVVGADVTGALDRDAAGGWRLDVTVMSDSLLVRTGVEAPEAPPRDTAESDTAAVRLGRQARQQAFADSGRVRLRAVGPTASFALLGRAGADVIAIEDGRVEQAGASLELTGGVRGLRHDAPVVSVRLANEALDASVLPDLMLGSTRGGARAELAGTVSVAFEIDAPGRSGDGPAVRGSVALRDVDVSRAGARLAESLDGVVDWGPAGLTIDSVSGMLAGGPFALVASVSGPDRWLEGRTAARLDLGVLHRAGLTPEGAALSGGLSLDVAFAGSLEVPEAIGASGVADLEGVRLEHRRFAVPLYVPDGELDIDGREASWSNLTVMAGADPLVTSGRVRELWAPGIELDPADGPRLEASLEGRRLALDAIFPLPERPAPSYARVAFAHLGTGQIEGRPASELARELGFARPGAPALEASLSFAIDSLSHARYPMDMASGTIELADSMLAIRDATFGVWGGRARGSLELALGPQVVAPFSLDLSFDSVGAGALLSTLTPVGDAVEGTMSLDLAIQGVLDQNLMPTPIDLTGAGRSVVSEGRVSETGLNLAIADFVSSDAWLDMTFERWESAWNLYEGAFDFPFSTLTGALGDVHALGVVRLDGAIDLDMALSIPPEHLADISLRRTGIGTDALERLRATGERLDVGIRVGGTLQGPTLEPDASVTVPGIRGAGLERMPPPGSH